MMYLHFLMCIQLDFFGWNLGIGWDTGMLNEEKNRKNIVCFNKIMISGCWSIWNHRIIFDNKGANIETYLLSFKKHFCIITKTSKPSLKEGSGIVRDVISFLHLLYIYTCTLSIILIENESQLGFNLLFFSSQNN
ncbi:hypothetical protein CFC21_056821 [Triticum aestivum]|uniref:Uncharacterized protein n=2 Tax=Triticum aestivum TaxID=4565 RepID=A0A9R1GIF4_WHEAT|nr:hypothetical protein CFC21_056821 [Triticum aestivum]